MSDLSVPQAYLLSRDAPEGLVQTAIAAFTITPLSCVIISDMKDEPLAARFHDLVLKCVSTQDAIDFAMNSFPNTNMPSLVIAGRAEHGMTAIHADGHLETLNWQAHASTIN